jgi:siroheme synthase-like protein
MTLSLKNNNSGKPAGEKQQGNPLFPVFLKLNNLHTVLIGAGNVGLEKLTAILNNSPDAKVTVIALAFLPEIHILAAEYKGVVLKQKSFAASDLDNANVVVAATNDTELNTYIVESAHERRLLVNVADKPDLCDFYLGSIVQKGDLKIAISTNGKSPTVAKRLKEVLNDALPEEIDTTLQQMSQLRDSLNGDFAEKVKTLNEITALLVGEKGIKNKSESPESQSQQNVGTKEAATGG